MRLATSLLLAALLSACAATPGPDGTTTPWGERLRLLGAVQQWQARGKLALRNGDQAETANLLWRQAGTTSDLQLSGPLGMSATRIHSDGALLEIQRGEEIRVLDISSPEAIVASTGWDLPLAALPHWMKGLPQPGSEPAALEVEQDLLRSLEQDGWRVEFQDYGRFGRYTLPTRLKAERGATSARLLIRHWSTGGEGGSESDSDSESGSGSGSESGSENESGNGRADG